MKNRRGGGSQNPTRRDGEEKERQNEPEQDMETKSEGSNLSGVCERRGEAIRDGDS